MKGGFYGLKVTQVSLILIGFVCVAVLMLAWTKTTVLDPPEGSVLILTPDEDREDSDLSGGKLTTDNPERKLDVLEVSNEDQEDSDLLGGKLIADNPERNLDVVEPVGSSNGNSFIGIDERENHSNSGDKKQAFMTVQIFLQLS